MAPKPGDRILVLRACWLDLVLAGEKTLEIRSRKLSPGLYWIGTKGEDSRSRSLASRDPDPDLQGTSIVKLHVLNSCNPDTQAFRQLRHLHCVDLHDLPYRKTYALPISHYRRLSPISYMHPRGAIGIVRYA